MNLLITNARVVDPSQDLDGTLDVLIEGGTIARIDKRIKANDVDVIDASGLVLAPGFIDLHTHLREPGQEHKETIATGTRAAVAGGYTAVCAMANSVPPNDERAVTEMVLAESARNGSCRVYPVGAVSKGLAGEELAELADLRAAGCVAVSDDGKPVYNAQLMRRALEYCSMLGMPLIAHEEDANLSDGGVMHEGYFSTLLGMRGIPAASEETLVARDVILAELTGAHVHIAHLSTAGAVEIMRQARERGVRVTAEVTPHHLALSDADVQSFSTYLKMNPPLRSDKHRQAILEGVADGTIDAIATDHAPHHFDEKNVEFDLAPFGVIGLETAFGVCYEQLVREGVIGLPRLIELLSTGPARIFNLPGGTLRAGSLGDVTLLDLDAQQHVTKQFASKAANSPFIGRTLQGRVVTTIVGGVVKYDIREPKKAAAPQRKRK
ncbi:MAG: dihydroorotase [Acidobacteria bacterium]|nr:dihydroorotase [Acidobacteriota bacterium]MBV9478352.1 dihydroorotase [Acidobacteriota bacterium]